MFQSDAIAIPSTSSTIENVSNEIASTSTRNTTLPFRATGISPTSEATSPIKPVLNNTPEHKIDILESISPKNNDLSETIQKLESAIQKSADHSHMSEDSSDSTDSEQRLVIEDESQSSETPNDLVLKKQETDQSYSVKQIAKETKSSTVIASKPVAVISSIPVTKEEKIERKDNLPPNEDKTEQLPLIQSTVDTNIVIDDTEARKQIDGSSTIEELLLITTIKTTDETIDIKKEDLLAVDNTQNESISLLLCEETIPGSPAPVCPKDTCDSVKKGYDMFPHPADIDQVKLISLDNDTAIIDNKLKSKNPTPGSSPRDSMSQDDSSEENSKKQGNFFE